MNPIIKILKKSTADYVPAGTPLIESSPRSREGLIVPELMLKYGKKGNLLFKFPLVLPQFAKAIINRFTSYGDLKHISSTPKTEASPELLKELEELAKNLGCRQIGFTTVPGEFIFKGKTILSPHAIVLTMDMNKGSLSKAPAMASGREIWRIYADLGMAVNKISTFLRSRGFAAQAGPALGGDVNYPLLAQKAGLGWIGWHGLLISPASGPSQRLAAIYTSIENLPSPPVNPHAWVGEFCLTCGRCVRTCPGQAIYNSKPIQKDGSPRHIDYKKCIVPFSQTMGCSVCIKECVFFKGDYKKIKERFLRS